MAGNTHIGETNGVLLALLPEQRRRLLAHSEQVNLATGDVLGEPGKPMRHVYFPNNGIISLLNPVDRHASVEVGLVGREGMAGMGLFLGASVSSFRMLVQASGTAARMMAVSFRNELRRNPSLRKELNKYLYVFMAQVAQTAACNRRHQLGPRLARRLLMTLDRVQSNEFELTQEMLANILGVRRVGVAKAAALLQKSNLIRYSRGHITIIDRKGLVRASCWCYGAVNDIRDTVFGW